MICWCCVCRVSKFLARDPVLERFAAPFHEAVFVLYDKAAAQGVHDALKVGFRVKYVACAVLSDLSRQHAFEAFKHTS